MFMDIEGHQDILTRIQSKSELCVTLTYTTVFKTLKHLEPRASSKAVTHTS